MGSPTQFFLLWIRIDLVMGGRLIPTFSPKDVSFMSHDFLARRKMADKKNPECNPPHLADAADLPDATIIVLPYFKNF